MYVLTLYHGLNMGRNRSIIWKISKDKLQEVVNNNECYNDVLKHFGFSVSNLRTLKRRLREDNINFKHFKHYNVKQLINFNKDSKIPLKDILVENSSYSRYNLKKRLLEEGLLEYKCYNPDCSLTEWLGKPISLQLDHINGINDDNRLENLRLLCPNCHSQTKNFSGRNTVRRKERNNCIDCGKEITKNSNRCNSCAGKKRQKVKRLTKEELKELLDKHNNWSYIGRMFGVSDNAVRKWARNYGLI